MKYLVVLLLLMSSVFAKAQETVEDVVMQYQDGKLYLVHVAEAGNTLYGMQTVYNVPVEQIVKANPGAEKGLKVGTTYLIPQGTTTIKAKNGTTLIKHVVVKGETLYALSKKYGSDVNEVNSINPDVAAGLKLGQIIYFPVVPKTNVVTPVVKDESTKESVTTTVQFTDSIVNYVVKKGETLYTISKRYMISATELQKFNNLKSTTLSPGSTLKIPVKKEKIDQVPIREIQQVNDQKVDKEILFSKKSEYNVVVLLPFGLDKTLGAGLKNLATEYYMGMMLAIDSLENEGIKATVNVVDFPIDSADIVQAFKKAEIKNAEIIIGPLMPQAADLVGNFCKLNKIRMVCPSSVNSSILKDNPYVYCAVASEITQQHILAKYTTENFSNAQIVLVNLDPKKDADLYQAYRTKYMELAAKNGAPKIIEVKLADFGSMIRKNG